MFNIYVGNLTYDTTETDLSELFGAYGEVDRVNIVMDRETGRSRGFGFVEMRDADAGRQAVEALNGSEMAGRTLTVNESRPREPRGGGGDRGGRW